MLTCLLRAFVPAEIVVTIGEVDIFLVENCCPLEWRSWKLVSNGRKTGKDQEGVQYHEFSDRWYNDSTLSPRVSPYLTDT